MPTEQTAKDEAARAMFRALKAIEARTAEAWNAQRPGDHKPELPDITRTARAAIAQAEAAGIKATST
jgi:hypothetical protein